MARFDVYTFKGKSVPLVVDIQANLLEDLDTRVVMPLIPELHAKQEITPRLKPIVKVNGENYVLMTTDIGTVTKTSLGAFVCNIEKDFRQDITNALDFLFQGF